MPALGPSTRRLLIYFFYDRDGVVDDYVVHMLRGFTPHVAKVVFVVNGRINAEGREKVGSIEGLTVLKRKNEGFDVWAYKSAIDKLGWKEVLTYDEVIMANFTIMGPVESFGPMFDEMDRKDLDFWGITVHNGAQFDPWGNMPEGTVPRHLQSHFIAVRRKMLGSAAYRAYWDDMGPIRSYADAVGKHEALFTNRFSRLGYTWEAYVETSDSVGRLYYPLFNMPVELIANRSCPIFKRKVFFAGADAFLQENSKHVARDLFEYLRDETNYPVALVVEHLIRSVSSFSLHATLNLTTMIDSRLEEERSSVEGRVFYILGAESVFGVRRLLPLLKRSGNASCVLIVPRVRSLRIAIDTLLAAHGLGYLQVVDADSWIEVELDAEDDDIVMVIEPSWRISSFPYSVEDSVIDDLIRSLAPSDRHVRMVQQRFARDPYLGMLVPPQPLHGVHFASSSEILGASAELVEGWLEKMNLSVEVRADEPVIAPLSGGFWFRFGALRAVQQSHSLRDLDLDSTAMHETSYATALHSLLPLVVQSAGFYPMYVVTPDVATNRITILEHYLFGMLRAHPAQVDESFASYAHRFGPSQTLAE